MVLVAFDNILDTQDAIDVDVDQKGLGILWAKWLIAHIPNGGSVFRIYRDVRFSKDKRPYKENAGCFFRHEAGKNAHAPGFPCAKTVFFSFSRSLLGSSQGW